MAKKKDRTWFDLLISIEGSQIEIRFKPPENNIAKGKLVKVHGEYIEIIDDDKKIHYIDLDIENIMEVKLI